MAFWCIDPTNGSNITGSVQVTQALAETTPYQTHAAIIIAVPASGDSVLFKGGDLELGLQTMTIAGLIYGSYGTGKGGIDANSERFALNIDTTTADNLTLDNLEFKGGKFVSFNAITVNVGGDNTTDKSLILSNLYVHDAEPSEVDGDGHGFDIKAAGVSMTDCLIHGFPDDGIFNEGADNTFSYLTVYDVDKSVTSKSGDCLKCSGIDSQNCHIHHCLFDHSSTNRKHSLILDTTNGDHIAEHNRIIGGEWCINSKGPGDVLRRNLIEPLAPNASQPVQITTTIGISTETGANQRIESNIILSGVGKEPNHGVRLNSDDSVVQGNVIYGPMQTGSNYAHIRLEAGSTGNIIRNNIIGGSSAYRINCSATAVITSCDYNIYLEDGTFNYAGSIYANLAAWQAGTGFDTNSIIVDVDTLFKDAENGDFRLNVGQEVLGVQLNYRDFLGNQNLPTIIGAYNQPLTDTAGSVTNAAGTVGTAAGTVLASSGILLNKKYPNWGIRA